MLSLARIVLLAIAVIAPPVVRGQDTLAAIPGARARVYVAPSGTGRVGVVERIAPDTLFLRPCVDCLVEAVPREAVQHIDVSIGRANYALRGVGIGFLAGAAIGGLAANYRCHHAVGTQLFSSCGYDQAMGGFLGAFAGMFIGGAIGRWWPKERWRPAGLMWPMN